MAREISRQTFLRGAAGALAAGTVFGSARAIAEPLATGWEGLSAAIGGHVLLPGGGQFAAAKQVFNTNYNGSSPAAIVTPTSVADVQKAMAFATSNKLHVAPRSGGHSYTGASTANGAMVFDLRQLPGGVDYDAASGRVTAPAATHLWELHQVLAAAGRGIPTGICPTVGAAGHALGGGLGAQSRHAGLLSDALTSATVVLPGGQAVTASGAENPDLFWALRGGGGGNFGVTTSLTFSTFPVSDVDVVNLHYPPESFAQVLVGWQNWLRTADRNSWALADGTTDATGTHCRIMGTCPAGSGNSMIGAVTKAVGLQPAGTDIQTLNYLDLVKYLAGNLNPAPLGYVGGSDVFTVVDAGAAQGITAAMNAFPRDGGPHAGDHARSRRRARHGGAWRHRISVAKPLRACAVVRREQRFPVDGGQLAQDGTPSGATVFGRRLCELPGSGPAACAVLRPESVQAQRGPAEVRPQPSHVLRDEHLAVNFCRTSVPGWVHEFDGISQLHGKRCLAAS